MADIRNPLTGRTFHQVDSTLAEILVDAGVMEYNRAAVQPMAAPRPKENTFKIGQSPWGKLCITLTTPLGAVTHFSGDPVEAKTAFQTPAWSGAENRTVLQGPTVPANILSEYAAQYKYERAVQNATASKIEQAADKNHGS